MKVVVNVVGQTLEEVDVETGATVKDSIEASEVDLDTLGAKEVRLNKELVDLTTVVKEGDYVQIIPKLEGGRT